MNELFDKVRACRLCAADLPLGPRPVVRGSPAARILIIGQAPGTKVHKTGIPWNDPSGERLRTWMGVSKDLFYDESLFAIMPMGFCYPGRLDKGGDRPPEPRCAPKWHDLLLQSFENVQLTLLAGRYAQARYLGASGHKTLRDTVFHWQDYLPKGYFPLPHPSWRVAGFIKKNPWFEEQCVPDLKRQINHILSSKRSLY